MIETIAEQKFEEILSFKHKNIIDKKTGSVASILKIFMVKKLWNNNEVINKFDVQIVLYLKLNNCLVIYSYEEFNTCCKIE